MESASTYQRQLTGEEYQLAFAARMAAARGEGIIVDLPRCSISCGRLRRLMVPQFSLAAASLFRPEAEVPLSVTIQALRRHHFRFAFFSQRLSGGRPLTSSNSPLGEFWVIPPHVDARIIRVYIIGLLAGEDPPFALRLGD